MIPIRLSVRNFLCYRENVPPLDFTGIHVACLCGPNGHGKSALLDAITWCLWGKARGRTQDELVSYGADEARVELEFSARDANYRVIRSHLRGGGRRRQGASDLQLQIFSGTEAQSISGNSVRETQAKIEQVVGMDYDTFINSAFLMQGRADEFTSKTPADRKAVLASILGLDAYDQLQARARERLAETRSAADQTDGALQQMRRELEQLGDPSVELMGVSTRLAGLEKQLTDQRQAVDGLRGQVTGLETKRSQLADLQGQIQTSQGDISQLESGMANTQRRITEYRALIQQADLIQQATTKLQEARLQFNAQEESRRKSDEINAQKAVLERTISTMRARLEANLEQLRRQVEVELPPKAEAGAALLTQQAEARQRMEQLSKEGDAVAELKRHQQTLATSVGEVKTAAQRYNSDGQELKKKLELLTDTAGEHAGLCPLCLTPLAEDGCQRLTEAYQNDIEEMRRLYRQNQGKLRELEAETKTLEKEVPSREQALSDVQRDLQLKLIELQRRLDESREARQMLELARPQLQTQTASLETGDFAATEQAQVNDLDTQIQRLGYDERTRRASYEAIQELQPFEEKLRRLTEAATLLPQEEESLAQSAAMVKRRQDELSALETQHRAGEEAITELPQWTSRLQQGEQALSELDASRQTALARHSVLEHQVRQTADLQSEITRAEARQLFLQDEQGIYQELVTAFGRQGIQAMLIETVVPRIEEEANLLLGRMTDNRMHLKLETQRERRTGRGEPIETLEINVSDELGPRAYEMYSGGEAFRINLALRVALSKVLAQRTGTPLPTLFIDEGFGTQDTAGRERILDVISSIQDDFDKIIVITHLEDLKDMFPVRIEVRKGADGSTFWLS